VAQQPWPALWPQFCDAVSSAQFSDTYSPAAVTRTLYPNCFRLLISLQNLIQQNSPKSGAPKLKTRKSFGDCIHVHARVDLYDLASSLFVTFTTGFEEIHEVKLS
jgi:hypothetical protein